MLLTKKQAIYVNVNSDTYQTIFVVKYKFTEKFEYSSLQIMYDYINHTLPCSFDYTWIRNDQRAERILRNARSFDIPYARLQSFTNFPLSNFPNLWNEIIIPNTNLNVNPVNNEIDISTFTEIMTKKQFSKRLHKLLLDRLTLLCGRDNCAECN